MIFITSGFVILCFILFTLLNKTPVSVTPIPEDDGVKIIYLSPSP